MFEVNSFSVKINLTNLLVQVPVSLLFILSFFISYWYLDKIFLSLLKGYECSLILFIYYSLLYLFDILGGYYLNFNVYFELLVFPLLFLVIIMINLI